MFDIAKTFFSDAQIQYDPDEQLIFANSVSLTPVEGSKTLHLTNPKADGSNQFWKIVKNIIKVRTVERECDGYFNLLEGERQKNISLEDKKQRLAKNWGKSLPQLTLEISIIAIHRACVTHSRSNWHR